MPAKTRDYDSKHVENGIHGPHVVGRNKEGSLINVRKKRLEEQGLLKHDGEDWTDDQRDEVLNDFFNVPDRCTIQRAGLQQTIKTGRTKDAVQTACWKIAAHYPPHHLYTPGPNRISRKGLPFTKADYAIMKYATAERGIENGAHTPEWMGVVLARDPKEISNEWARLTAKREKANLLALTRPSENDKTQQVPDEPEEVRVAKLVHKILEPIVRDWISSFNQVLDKLLPSKKEKDGPAK